MRRLVLILALVMAFTGTVSGGVQKPLCIGTYEITHYCPCEKCCGKWANGITSTGVTAKAGRTIAVDPKVIPYGTTVWIDGHAYIAEDCGGAIKGNHIDVYCDSHSEALTKGKFYTKVYAVIPNRD